MRLKAHITTLHTADIMIHDPVRYYRKSNDMTTVNGVGGVHHAHLWSLCSDINVLDEPVYSCERDVEKIETMKQEIKERLKKYRILHLPWISSAMSAKTAVLKNTLKNICGDRSEKTIHLDYTAIGLPRLTAQTLFFELQTELVSLISPSLL